MNKLPGIYIHSDNPRLSSIFDMVDNNVLLYDDGTFNIPSQLHGLNDEYLWILLNGGLIRIFITDWIDPKTHQHKRYTNKEDIEILRKFATDTNENFAERVGRMSSIITRSVITIDSIDKEMVKTFWKNYYNHILK